MKNKYIFITIVLFLLFEIIFSINNICFADIPTEDITLKKDEITVLEEPGNKILGLIKLVGVFVAVGATMVLGYKYMSGSIQEQAKYKEWTILYLIGIVLLFGIVGIVRIINNLL